MVWISLENVLFNSQTASNRNLRPHSCQTQGYSGSEISRDTEISSGCLLMTLQPMMTNVNMGVLGTYHCFKAQLSNPLVRIPIFSKGMKLLGLTIYSQIFDWDKSSQSSIKKLELSSENFKPKYQADQKLSAVRDIFWGHLICYE